MQSSLGVKTLLQDPALVARTKSYSADPKPPMKKPQPSSAPVRPVWQNPNALPARSLKKYNVTLNHVSQESRISSSAPYASRRTLGSPTRAQATGGRSYLNEPYNALNDQHLARYYARRFDSSASKTKLFKSAQKGRRRKGSGIVYKVVVRTDDRKHAGTNANVFIELKGSKGILGKTRLFQKPDGIKSNSYLHEPIFSFKSGSEETFTIRGPDIGDVKVVNIEHDGLERKQGWFLLEILVKNTRNKKVWTFPCFQWLSLYESDCQIKRQLIANSGTSKPVKTVYEVSVETGDIRGAGTDAKVYMTLFGSKGTTPKVLLSNRDNDNFERGKTDRFKIKSTGLGALRKIIVEHDNTGFGPGWYLNKVTVTELVKGTVTYFPCDQWLDKDEGDGQIRRQLMATKKATDTRKGYKYKVCTYTGDVRGAGTDANVTITVFGENGDTGEHCLDNSRNNFEKGRMDTFRLEAIDLGELVKLRIGHDNRGVGPGWFLDKVTVEDEARGKVFDFPCHRWFAKDEDDRQVTRELICVNGSQQADMYITPGVPYSFHVTTGDVRNASTSANVFVVLYGGEDGKKNSGKLVLRNEKNDNFERGRTDIFQVETADCLSPLHHITIGHDNTGLGAGWFCDKLVVDCPSTGCQQVFLCQQWIADDEGDGRLERDLYESEDMRQKRRPKIVYNVWVWTSDVRGSGTDANVFITLYGKKGKTDEIQIGNATDNFEQGQLDKFKVELANVGSLYKLRVRHDNSKPFSDWHLEKVIVQRTLASKSLAHAKGGTILAGFLKVIPMFIMVMPGMISRVLYRDTVGCSDAKSCEEACGNELGCTNQAYPKLVFNLLPTGLTGLMMAVMIAAVMSSLSSVYNSCSTIFTVDVWQYIRPRATEREKVIVGRVVVVSLVGLGVVWLPFIDSGSGSRLFKYIQTIQALLGSPIMAVFSIGILWPRANGWGGLGGLVFGTILGIIRFITEYVYPAPKCGEVDDRPGFVSLNFMYFGVILFAATAVVIVVISLLTVPIPKEDLAGLTWATLSAKKTGDQVQSRVNVGSDEYEMNGHGVANGKMSEHQIEANGDLTLEEDILHESKSEKILNGVGTILLLLTLAFLWIWYR